ncbi:MAG: porin family protein [Bacteroidota bacterium]|nr:porin family protein [Bacteroidota bacterium]
MNRHYIYLIIISLLLLVTPTVLTAQKKVQYLQYEDLKPYHFGFLIGMNTQDLIFNHSGKPDADGHRWYGSIPSYTPGFSVGVIGDLRLADFLSLRLTPTIHFGSKDVALITDAPGATPIYSEVRSNYIMLPLNLRYRGARTGNFRPYFLSGLSAGIDMGRDKREPILLEPVNTYLELGVGSDLYLPYFRLVPELKFCLGLGDIFIHDRSDEDSEVFLKYTNAFDKITSRLIVFSLQFE